MQVKKTFHGHHHDRRDYREHDVRLGFEAHGVGLCGVSDQSGRLIKAGSLDSFRKYKYLRCLTYVRLMLAITFTKMD